MPKSIPIEQILVYGNLPSSVFYKTPEWKRARYQALTIHGNRCQLCGAGPKSGALHVDHIKPRFLYPESCLDIHNLQILCEDCHVAKGIEWLDDFRKGNGQKPPVEMRDFFRIERRHLSLEHRPPRDRAESEYLSVGVRSTTKKHRQRWRLFVHFCLCDQRTYASATQLRVGEFMLTKRAQDHRYAKFVHLKHPDDFVFEIGGCLFPLNMRSLLADDQLGGDQ